MAGKQLQHPSKATTGAERRLAAHERAKGRGGCDGARRLEAVAGGGGGEGRAGEGEGGGWWAAPDDEATPSQRANMRLVLTAWPPVDLPREVVLHATVATCDASDKAHNVHEPGTSLLINGEAVNTQGKARRYPRSQMTSRGVAFDSSFDELHLRSSRLARAGVRDLGPATVRAAGGDACSRLSADAIARGRGVARGLQKVIDCNRAVWECGPMPRW